MRLYLDSSVIIYSLEGVLPVREMTVSRIAEAEASHGGAVITSRLARLECRVKPLREGALEALALVDAFFARPGLVLAEVTAQVLEGATELRARHGFKIPDAVHLATAFVQGADIFLTGDVTLARCPGMEVAILDPASER